MNDYLCPRCGQRAIVVRKVAGGAKVKYEVTCHCSMCNQVFKVYDDGKTRNEALTGSSYHYPQRYK